jgi:hypothetical protein
MLPMRQILLAGALVVTLAASLFDLPGLQAVPTPEANVAPVVVAARVLGEPPSATASAPVRAHFASQTSDLFAAGTWQPPPPPPPKAAAPKAPALPFRYLGKVLDDGQIMVFLGQSAQTHLVKKGDTLSDYKVEDITMAGMTFVYLPLNEKQQLIFGSAN